MKISAVGEFGLIDRFKRSIRLDRTVIVGPGDDCAVLALDRDSYQLATCDMLVEGVDFTKKDDPALVGRKSLAVSISDIAACGGIPTHALVSLGLPPKTDTARALAIGAGITRLAASFGINVVGGDISRAGEVIINVSLYGIVEKKNLVLRKGARKGDIIFVTGSLGGSIRGKHLSFNPRLAEARFLVKNFRVSSMIDISDGLVQDLGHIAEASCVGALLHEELIPLSRDAAGKNEALYMGEDFELIFTLGPQEAARLISSGEPGFRAIGIITDKKNGLKIMDPRQRIRALKKGGWRHF